MQPVFTTVLIITAVLLTIPVFAYKPHTASRNNQFTVVGNQIFDPGGNIFVMKGVTTVYGTFAGGDENGYGMTNYQNAQRDFDIQQKLGINTVRIFVTTADNDTYHETRLQNVVHWARQRGFVVEISNSLSTFSDTLPWLSYLAETYKNDPYVWISPMNEPNCNPPGNREMCDDWGFWQNEENTYIATIRRSGMLSPIVIDGLNWSWDLSKIDAYPLNDSNIIYGAHRYANDQATFDASEGADCNNLWANLASSHVIIVEEVGNFDYAGIRNSFVWVQGFIDYVTAWVKNRGGGGVIAFVWYWSDPNSMTDANGKLNDWGTLFYTHYLQRV